MRHLDQRVSAGTADRHSVLDLVSSIPGTDVGPAGPAGPAGPVEPATPGDQRVEVLARVLEERHWRGLSRDRLCVDVMAALDEWQTGRDAFHRDLRRLLGER